MYLYLVSYFNLYGRHETILVAHSHAHACAKACATYPDAYSVSAVSASSEVH